MACMARVAGVSRLAGEVAMSMFLQVRPILSALRSHRAAVMLLVLEIALTMAILGNLFFIVSNGMRRVRTTTGVAEQQIGVIGSINAIGVQNSGTTAGNLAVLRDVPGVTEAAYSGGPPLSYAARNQVFLDPARLQSLAQVYEFQGSQGFSRTLGVHIVQGRDFIDEDLPPVMDKIMGTISKEAPLHALITRALADRLYPDGKALGRMLYDGSESARVIGIVDHLRGQITGRADDDYSLVIEFRVGAENMGGSYLIRSDPARLSETLRAAAAALQKANPGHVQAKVVTFDELRADYFRGDVAVGRMLIAIMLILLAVTTLGVGGLASFWVQQRRRQIGMRRALGATRTDILRYFQIENFLIVSGGVALGAVVAYALNLFLMQRFELPHLPPGYLAMGAVALWTLGQLAVLGPALRAAAVPPVVATRAV
jgi:putative ABC transport system permease protein